MIYLDNAGTTKPLKEVTEKIVDIQTNNYFNAGAGYEKATQTKHMVENARSQVAKAVKFKEENVIFTSCATEANNQIIRSLVNSNKNCEYVFSEGEHPSVYNVALDLKQAGHKVVFIPLDKTGKVDEEKLYQSINQNTRFVSVMYVSNETGAINNLQNISRKIKEINPQVFIHSDCVQALGKLDINFRKLGVDAITISSHKIYGGKGAGALIVKDTNKVRPFLIGGGQENSLRSGTENVEAICGFGLACSKINLSNQQNIQKMSDLIKTTLSRELKDDIIIVSAQDNIPNIISIIFKKIKGEVFVRFLDQEGIIVSKGSACSTKKSGNRILSSMGYSNEEIIGNVRISIGNYNTFEEINFVIQKIIDKYKEMKIRMGL